MKKVCLRLALFSILSWNLMAQQIFPGGGLGSYRTNYPGWNYAHHIYAPIGDNTQSHIHKGPNYTGPLQTHQWWTSALWDHGNIVVNDGAKTLTDLGHDEHSGPMYPYPLFLQASDNGYILRYGETDINGLNDEVEIHSAVIDARVGLQGQSATVTSVDDYGDWHAVFYQNYGGGNTLRMTAAKGNPFAFFQRTGTINPVIYGLNKVVVRKSTSGNSFIFQVAPEGRPVYFGVFFPAGTLIGNAAAPVTPITALGTGGYGGGWSDMVFGLPAGNNYFSVAVMRDISQATLDLYEARAFNFVTETTHTYTFNEATSTLTTSFVTTTTPVYGGANIGTLQALMKHQYLHSPQAATAANTGLIYRCPRGDMQVLATNTFTTEMTHYGILPNLGWAHRYSVAQMRAYIDNYLPTINIPQIPADGYNKDGMVDLANVAQIASQIGYITARNRCLDALQQRLTNWFTAPMGEDWALFIYSSDFNWMAHYPNGFGSSGTFIDMHFHMAYLVYGAAILARYRPAWAAQYGGMVETMIRQINDYRKDNTNPGNIGWFPYLRFFDPYEGHSWAGPDASDQESVSESLLFAQGTFLWGETVGNNNLRDLGALLYITEAEAAKLYWFDVDEDVNYNWGGTTYPQHHVTIVRSRGSSYATYFSADDRWKHAIVLLPQSAGSLWFAWDPAQAQTIYNHLPAPTGYTNWDEFGYHFNFVQAAFNATAAKTAFSTYAVSEQWINPTFPHVNGDIPVLYQWINTFDSVGVYDNTVQADITGFSVFTKGTCKHYMVYMPPGKGPRTVNFSDGQSFLVPNDTVIVYKVCATSLPVEWLSVTAEYLNENLASVSWKTASESNVSHFELERSTDGQTWEWRKSLPAKGNSNSIQSYQVQDKLENPNAAYFYRIRQVDLDGSFTFSQVVRLSKKSTANLYPNPSTGWVFADGYDASLPVEVLDITGRSVMQTSIQSGSLDLSELPNGVYMLLIQNEQGIQETHKVVLE
ncbi:MAG: glycosyl hydrolase [Cytophagaceae bacterium]|nr:glycosyl hydrolase [Cytophagaceae bacterium]